MSPAVQVLPEQAGERIDRFLAAERADLSRSRIQKLISEGLITINGASVTKASVKLAEGDEVMITIPEPEPSDLVPEDIPLDIVYEDGDIIVVNKSAGMVVHPSAGHDSGTLVHALLGHGGDLSGVGGVLRPGIVHRLDKDTSGLIVIAKNDNTHRELSGQLQRRELTRIYVAVVKGTPKTAEGTIETGIGRHRRDRKKMAVLEEGGREAVTMYEVAQQLEKHSLLEIKLSTGRTHQIRVHMAHINHPVVGDLTYGRKEKPALIKRQALHAWQLRLVHPVSGEAQQFKAPIPEDMEGLIQKIGGDPTRYR